MCSIASNRHRARTGADGFTFIELLLAVAILAMVTTVAAVSLYAASKAWSRGNAMTEGLHHGDYVMEQLVMALRSAYYPDGGRARSAGDADAGEKGAQRKPAPKPMTGASQYGFYHEDGGEGPGASDRISWVKIGRSLVGGAQYAETPHRVEFTLEEEDGVTEAKVRAWQAALLDEAFDPDTVPSVSLSRQVLGFDCLASSTYDEESGEIEWEEEWENTNSIPQFVQITLYVTGPSEDEPLELVRLVELPCGPLAPKE
jgi:prepilin-type N-terminal cleavage/methylation domain-containing protein